MSARGGGGGGGRRRQRKSPKPKKYKPEEAKRMKKRKNRHMKTPVWDRAPGRKLHPALDAQLAKPFLSTIFIDPDTASFCYPYADGEKTHVLGGLHARILSKFFHGRELPERFFKKGSMPLKLASSKREGSKADKILGDAIAAGRAPPERGEPKHSPYASAVWDYW